ncbi:MAG: hypothetical protein ABWX68_11625 [Arthrobacter sp.]|uniref:hypothetical protein n=1 Tax=Arthrobacter sp. TaxID=1667 RepID=UPI00346CA142
MRTRPSPRLVALLAAVLLLPLIVVAGLAVSAGAGAAPASHGFSEAGASDRHCPDGSPVSACHPRSEFPAPAPGAAPRPDLDTAWGVPGPAAASAVRRPGVPHDPAPDLIALSISRT